ncbi:DUF4352 domain-containing protein [Streptomyces sp. NPDC060194]|uniref:DUF4352 domain-containing protein n=1 Tax=Streptomyces sp. NPDC060194 TaxID=3347069 RepID=UPI00364F7B6D
MLPALTALLALGLVAPASAAAASTVDVVAPPRSAVAAEDDDKDEPGLNDPVRDGKFEFTVTKVKGGVGNIGGSDFGEDAQGQYYLVYLTVENIGDEAQIFMGDDQILLGPDDQEYSSDTMAEVLLENSESFLEEINPGNKVEGILAFDIPESVTPDRIELHDSFLSDGVTVQLR